MIMGFSPIHSQVLTRHLAPDQNTEEIIPFPLDENIPYYMQPEVDFDKVLEQDMANGITIPRFAVKVEQNYTVKDGLWSQLGGMRIWQIGFSTSDASSLNFLISDLNLPIKSEMFILSKNGRIIHGPITPDVIFDQVYASDIIESNDAIIVVKCNKDNYNQFSITVNGVCQGIPKPIETRDFGDADSCNYDVNCSVGAGWENERDAVALVLKNGTEHCSGSLVNDECQDLRSFFLTAFHCLDSDHNGSLSNSEKDLSIYAFRFKYEAGTPTCPGNSTGTQGTWIIYSGAAFRAANNATDFALAELYGSIKNQPRIALTGWDRRNITPQTTTIIHHPAGDAKKITFDYNPAQQATIYGKQCWNISSDVGGLQKGSSGAPYFNQNGKIIGQHYTRSSDNRCENADQYGGRIDLSWIGGGSDDTRLSNWLGGSNPPNTTNTIRSSSINAAGGVVSPNNEFLICTTNKQFDLSNPIPGSSVTWSVSNPGLFATTGGAMTSGTGTTAILRAINSATSGSAILTFILTQSGCPDVAITRELWVGSPDFGLDYLDNICLGDREVASIDLYGAYGMSLGTISWSFSGAITGVGSTAIARYQGVSTGWGNICLTATNGCGTTTKCFWVYVNECKNYQKGISDIETKSEQYELPITMLHSPNPVQDKLTVRLSRLIPGSIFTITDVNGQTIFSSILTDNKVDINMSGHYPGIYFIQYSSATQTIISKIIKL